MIFKLDQRGFGPFKKKMVIRILPIYFLILIMVLFIIGIEDVTFPYLMVLVIGALAFALYNQVRKQRKIWETFELEMTEDEMIRRQRNHKDICIRKNEVTQIIRIMNGGLCIKGKDRFNAIFIPGKLEQEEDLLSIISEIGEIKEAKESQGLRKLLFFMIPFMALMVVFYISENKYLITGSGMIIVAFMCYSSYALWKTKMFNKKLKYSLIFLPVIILAFLYRIVVLWV